MRLYGADRRRASGKHRLSCDAAESNGHVGSSLISPWAVSDFNTFPRHYPSYRFPRYSGLLCASRLGWMSLVMRCMSATCVHYISTQRHCSSEHVHRRYEISSGGQISLVQSRFGYVLAWKGCVLSVHRLRSVSRGATCLLAIVAPGCCAREALPPQRQNLQAYVRIVRLGFVRLAHGWTALPRLSIIWAVAF